MHNRLFLSSNLPELKVVSDEAEKVSMRLGLKPKRFDYNKEFTNDIVDHFVEVISECDFFVGIYSEEYGDPIISNTKFGSNISLIELELRIASDHFDSSSLILFSQGNMNQDARLKKVLSNYRQSLIVFEDELNFNFKLAEQIKGWISVSEKTRNKSEFFNSNVYSIVISSFDKPGLLSTISRCIALLRGNMTQADQEVHQDTANIRIIAEWEASNDKLPKESELKDRITDELRNVHGESAMKALDVNVSKVALKEREIKAKGHFMIQFFDQRGIADRLFQTFAIENISIIESSFRLLSKNPQIGRYKITANMTAQNRDFATKMADKIRDVSGVYYVEENVEMGNWLD